MTTMQTVTPLYLMCRWLRNGNKKSDWQNYENNVREVFGVYVERQIFLHTPEVRLANKDWILKLIKLKHLRLLDRRREALLDLTEKSFSLMQDIQFGTFDAFVGKRLFGFSKGLNNWLGEALAFHIDYRRGRNSTIEDAALGLDRRAMSFQRQIWKFINWKEWVNIHEVNVFPDGLAEFDFENKERIIIAAKFIDKKIEELIGQKGYDGADASIHMKNGSRLVKALLEILLLLLDTRMPQISDSLLIADESVIEIRTKLRNGFDVIPEWKCAFHVKNDLEPAINAVYLKMYAPVVAASVALKKAQASGLIAAANAKWQFQRKMQRFRENALVFSLLPDQSWMERQLEWADKISLQIGMHKDEVLERMLDVATAINSERERK